MSYIEVELSDGSKFELSDAQSNTYESLISVVEEMELAVEDGSLVFEGQGSDGPAMGYLEPDGTIFWIVMA